MNVSDDVKNIKLVLVGDTPVGKTCLIRQYRENCFSDEYEPTVLEVYSGTKNISGKDINLEIHDTSGFEHLGTNRAISYNHADVFAIVVALDYLESYERISGWK